MQVQNKQNSGTEPFPLAGCTRFSCSTPGLALLGRHGRTRAIRGLPEISCFFQARKHRASTFRAARKQANKNEPELRQLPFLSKTRQVEPANMELARTMVSNVMFFSLLRCPCVRLGSELWSRGESG
jgi:hypothetical protein